MATAAYHRWDRDGRPWKPALPVKALAEILKAHGYVVYVIGADDQSHLQADEPEDHCPFSRSGWPGQSPYGWVLAADVMPPKKGQKSKVDGKPLPSLAALGRQLRTDKMSGHAGAAWIKYMNWEPGDGHCWHDSWQSTYKRRASDDRGHIHLSGRTDYVTSHCADGYDPVARIRTASQPGGDMGVWDDDVIDLWGAHKTKANPTARPMWVLSHIGQWAEETRAEVIRLRADAAALRAGQAAILGAVQGLDTKAVLALINQVASAEASRDAAMLLLIQQHADGTLDAEAVVQRIGELLAAPPG